MSAPLVRTLASGSPVSLRAKKWAPRPCLLNLDQFAKVHVVDIKTVLLLGTA